MKWRMRMIGMLMVLVAGQVWAGAPKVARITPSNGAEGVDPNLKAVVIEFDQEMGGGRSLTGSYCFPEIAGELGWRDSKTFVMPVKLYADQHYQFGINSRSRKNFRGVNGQPVEPVFVKFRTRKAKPGEQVNKKPGAPKVVRLTPANFSQQIDPDLKEIVIEFDQPMAGGRSVTGGGESFPKIDGKLYWRDAKTFVMQVALKPNHKYRFGVNSRSHRNFTNQLGMPVTPVGVTFRTGERGKSMSETDVKIEGAGGKVVSAAEQIQAWDRLADLMSTQYSYRDLHGLDWQKLCEGMKHEVDGEMSLKAFGGEVRWLLTQARDMHVRLGVDGKWRGTHVQPAKWNMNHKAVKTRIEGLRMYGGGIISGKVDGGLGYIYVGNLSGERGEQGSRFYEALKGVMDAEGLILDLRGNGGGSEMIGRDIAGCFVDKSYAYAKHVSVLPGSETGFSKVRTRYFDRNDMGPVYRGKVVVLVGNVCMSSCEALVLMMKQVPGAVVMGERTRGSSGNPQRHEVIDGVEVSLPSWRAMDMDGVCFEGVGIRPDVEVKAGQEDFERGDPVFERAVMLLMGEGQE